MTTKFTRFPYLTLSYQIDLDPISALIDLDSVCSSASAFERRASTCANIASACHEEKRKRHCGQDSSDPRTTDNHVCKCMQAMHGQVRHGHEEASTANFLCQRQSPIAI